MKHTSKTTTLIEPAINPHFCSRQPASLASLHWPGVAGGSYDVIYLSITPADIVIAPAGTSGAPPPLVSACLSLFMEEAPQIAYSRQLEAASVPLFLRRL